jgi:hypothetical protein
MNYPSTFIRVAPSLRTALLLAPALLLPACKDEPAPSPRECHEALARGQSLLSVPDHAAARDWLARAEQQCRADARADVDAFRREIEASEKRRADAEEEKRRALAPKPASESLAPEIARIVTAYRDDPTRRTKCDADTPEAATVCESTRHGEHLQANVASARKDAAAYSVVVTLEKELVGCAAFGPHEVKRTWKRGDRPQIHCLINDGPLASLSVLIDQTPGLPSSDVTVFTAAWLAHDPQLALRLKENAGP